MRPLAHFFAIGAVLFVAKGALPRLLPADRPSIEVVVPRSTRAPESARGAALTQRVDEAILVEEGLRFGPDRLEVGRDRIRRDPGHRHLVEGARSRGVAEVRVGDREEQELGRPAAAVLRRRASERLERLLP